MPETLSSSLPARVILSLLSHWSIVFSKGVSLQKTIQKRSGAASMVTAPSLPSISASASPDTRHLTTMSVRAQHQSPVGGRTRFQTSTMGAAVRASLRSDADMILAAAVTSTDLLSS